jgi:flagellar biosynthesis protein FliR
MKFPVFTLEQIEIFFLVFLRISTVVVMLPILGNQSTPARIKGGLAVLITMLVIPFVAKPAEMPADLFSLLLVMAGEVLIGIILGFASTIIFQGIQMAGDLVGFQMGFSIVNILDPVTSEQASIINEFQYMLAGLLFLSVNGHHVLILAVSESYTALPLLGFHLTGGLVQSLVEMSCDLFVIAVKISSPIVIALVFANIGLGLIARTVPQINILVVGFPLQIAIGLIGLGLTVPLFLYLAGGLFSNLPGQIGLLIRAM